MRRVKVVGAVEGKAVAYHGHRRLYPGDIVDLPDEGKLPAWAEEVSKKEKVDPAAVKMLGTARRFDAPNQKKRNVGFDGAASGDAMAMSEVAGTTRAAELAPPSAAEQVAVAGHERQQAEKAAQKAAVRAADADVLAGQ